MSDQELREFFAKSYGEVASVFSIKDDKGKSKGYGFIDFKNKLCAEQLISQKKVLFKGKIMIAKEFVQKSRNKDSKSNTKINKVSQKNSDKTPKEQNKPLK